MRVRIGTWLTMAALAASLATATGAGAASAGSLSFVGCLTSVVVQGCTTDAAISGAQRLAISPDGAQLYVPANDSNVFTVYNRNATTGALTQSACFASGAVNGCTTYTVLAGMTAVAVTPDGSNVYVTGGSSLAVFHRDGNGTLSYKACYGGGGACSAGIAAPTSVWATNDAVFVASSSNNLVGSFTRSGDTLSFVNCINNDGSGGCANSGNLFTNPTEIVVAPDEKHAYISNYNTPYRVLSVTVAANKTLSPRADTAACVAQPGTTGCGSAPALREATSLALAGNGTQLYVTSRYPFATPGEAIELIDVDNTTGNLSFHTNGCWVNPANAASGCTDTPGMEGPNDVAVSPDGAHVYGASLDGGGDITAFDRGGDGMLTQQALPLGCFGSQITFAGCSLLPASQSVDALIVSPDSRFLYADGSPFGSTSPTRLWTFLIVSAPPSGGGGGGGGAVDADGDHFVPPDDCNDSNAKINPGAKEIAGNTVDENCDGVKDAFVLIKLKGFVNGFASRPASCKGSVEARLFLKKKGKRIALISTKLNKCRWKATARLRTSQLHGAKFVFMRWHFGGNSFIAADDYPIKASQYFKINVPKPQPLK